MTSRPAGTPEPACRPAVTDGVPPVGDGRDWQLDAACFGMDPTIFSVDYPDGPDYFTAMRTCRGCPVKQECLDTALAHESFEDAGIWGGTTVTQRRLLRDQAARTVA